MKKTLAMFLASLLACAMVAGFAPCGAAAPSAAAAAPECVYYSEFGAEGDGETNDFDAIVAAHAYANAQGLPVRADPGAVYYIGDSDKTAIVQTDTDWGNARFIIDNSDITINRNGLFTLASALEPVAITSVSSLKKEQTKLDISLEYAAFVRAVDDTTTRYIRYVPDRQDSYRGEPQFDTFKIDKDGNVDPRTPIIWDFDNISSLMAYPIDPETLTIRGGHFTTVKNKGAAPYCLRNIQIRRSNVLIEGLSHDIKGEEASAGASYSSIIDIFDCADVTARNITLAGHKSFSGYDGYDLLIQNSLNVTIENCRQANDILDASLKAITGTNNCKNMIFDNVELNRIDSHKFAAGLTIRNSKIGWYGIVVTGVGTLLVENTRVYSGGAMITLRDDYGATWNGEIVIRSCEFVPQVGDAVLFHGVPSRSHDYGYPIGLPGRIIIDGLVIDDSGHRFFYLGPKIFGLFFHAYVDKYVLADFFACPKRPYAVTEEIAIRDLTVKSGRPLLLSLNIFRFRRWLFPTTKITALQGGG